MKRFFLLSTLALALLGAGLTPQTSEARERVVHRDGRAVVRVHAGFPIRRALPRVVVRSPNIQLRVSPHVYLPTVHFGARVIRTHPRRDQILWQDSENLSRREGWTEVYLDVNNRGNSLLLDISQGPAQLSFAEVVFENGETRVVDFADRQQRMGLYPLLDFRDGRRVDHVRLVARATGRQSEIGLLMTA
jgi:hypothetical protein